MGLKAPRSKNVPSLPQKHGTRGLRMRRRGEMGLLGVRVPSMPSGYLDGFRRGYGLLAPLGMAHGGGLAVRSAVEGFILVDMAL